MPNTFSRYRQFLAYSHGRQPFALIAKLAAKYLRAYNNTSNWNFEWNGEARVLSTLLPRLSGDVFDVGANRGEWSLAALRYLRAGTTVHCFEVIPDMRTALAEALRPFAEHAKINAEGLGSAERVEEINFDPKADTISSKYALIYEDACPQVIQAKITTGDAYCERESVKDISLLKIDVEGMEMDVLHGFSAAFAAGSVKAVQFEHGWSHILSGDTLRDFVMFFEERGFLIYEIFPHKFAEFTYDFSKEVYDGRNFLAVRRDVTSLVSL